MFLNRLGITYTVCAPMKKIVLAITMMSFLSAAFAVENATLNIKLKNGTVVSKIIPAQKRSDGSARIRVPKEEIPEGFVYFDIIADNATAMKGEDGFWIFGRGEMGKFKLDNGKYRVYPQLPMFGMKNPRETFMAAITGLQWEPALMVTAVNGMYSIFPRWEYKHMGYMPYEDIVVDYYPLTGDDANYSGMGRKYRQLKLESGLFKPFKERMKNNKALQQIATAMPHRIEPHTAIFGYRGKKAPKGASFDLKPSDVIDKVKPVLTFPDGKKFIDAFKAAGMTDVHFCDAGWQCGGYDGRCPQILPIEKCAGGQKALEEYVKYGQSLGYQMCCNANHTDAYTCSDMWDEDYVCKKADGSLFRVTTLNGGWMYYICIERSWQLFIKNQIDQTRKLGYEGIYYIDVFSARPPDQCFDPRHKLNRKEQAAAQNKVLSYARKVFGGAASECGFEHCLHNLDYVNYLGRTMLYGEGQGDRKFKFNAGPNDKPHYNPMIDRVAPLWEIVFHGIVLSNPDKFTQDYRPKGSTNHLRLIEFGGRPMFYSSSYTDAAIARYKEMYDAFQPLKHLQVEFMEENKELAPGVYLTRYSDGSEVVTNYTTADYSYKGGVAKARDYLLLKPTK